MKEGNGNILHGIYLLFLSLILVLNGCTGNSTYRIEGEQKVWHTLTFSFRGPLSGEQDFPNPFLNYRMNVKFIIENDTVTVPGFFAADGNSAESGADKGDTWQVRFKPYKAGKWRFEVSFREGDNLAVMDDPLAGTPVAPDGLSGSFDVLPSDKSGRDLRAHGRLEYVGERYLRFAGSGDYFLKGGADSPENFLACIDFDGTRYGGNEQRRMGEDRPNPDLHSYSEHVKDWEPGDPVWQEDKGKGIIGALNYLSSKGMNSVYFLTMNVMGDGEDVWPWTGRNERYRFDCSRLDQWEIVFDHMEKLGIMMHVVLQETENEVLLDGGRLDVQRKLYLRELIARFSHHLAITWNIGEENGPAAWTPVGQTIRDRQDMMAYIKGTDPYNSFVVTHTHSADPDHTRLIEPFLGFPYMDGPSLQLSPPSLIHDYTLKWIRLSEFSSRPWVVCSDEQGPHWMGVMPDSDDPSHDTIRSQALWGNLMAGGAGVEWYFGYNYDHSDLNCEDWRSRERMWEQTGYALEFFRDYLPFHQMKSHDELVPEGYCFAYPGSVYAVYLPPGNSSINFLDLTGVSGQFSLHWYNPVEGGTLLEGSVKTLQGGDRVSLGLPPAGAAQDWVALIRQAGK